ncbi:hypothetical protein AB4212_60745, partial [Streptomyces sp. 2MCAF27]
MLSPATLMRDGSGTVRGRNWTGERVTRRQVARLRVDRVLGYKVRPRQPDERVSDESAPWGSDAHVVGAAKLVSGGVRTRYGQVLTYEEFAEKLGHDPELSKLPQHVPVVLAIPYAATQYLELQRAVAARLGRRVWAPSGDGRLRYDGDLDAHAVTLIDRDDEGWLGDWVPFDPPPTTLPFTDRTW